MNEENGPDDWRDNIAVVAIVDAALLSVIRAHQPLPGVKDEDERKRLNDAKTALFGFKKHRGRPKDQDTPELVHMARAYMEDRGQPKLDSNYKPMFTEVDQAETGYQTELARQAIAARKKADPAYKPHNEEEKIRNLQQKYAESRDELIRLVVGWGGTNGGLIQMHVRHLAETLRLLGIPVSESADQDRELNSPI